MKTVFIIFAASVLLACGGIASGEGQPGMPPRDQSVPEERIAQSGRIFIRTENYPRPPYSGATYYIYERDGEVICTKLEVCNKYDDCEIVYKKGVFKDEIDIETGDPYDTTKPVAIAPNKLRRHVCLTKFKLIK
jgi:hypothetical protein